jgi:hypothetical protein
MSRHRQIFTEQTGI